jgi:hypothetical protein
MNKVWFVWSPGPGPGAGPALFGSGDQEETRDAV